MNPHRGSLRRQLTSVWVATAALILLAVGSLALTIEHSRRSTAELENHLIPAEVTISAFRSLADELAAENHAALAQGIGLSTQRLAEAHDALDKSMDRMDRLIGDPTSEGLVTQLRSALDDWSRSIPTDASASTASVSAQTTQHLDTITTLAGELHARIATAIDGQRDRWADAWHNERLALAITALVMVLSTAAAIATLRRRLVEPIADLLGQVRAIAVGDLSRSVVARGPAEVAETARSVEDMRQRLVDDSARRTEAALIAGHMAERTQIAGEIHDDPVQAMTYASIRLQQLARRIGDSDDGLATTVREARTATNAAIGRLRRMIFELHSPVLETDGLIAAIECYVEETFDPTVDWEVSGDVTDVPADTARIAYELTREALFNAFKHADASRLDVEVLQEGTALRVSVRDDGAGFDPTTVAAEPGHFGIRHAQQRTEALGGSWRIESEPGRGTCVTFELPISYPDAVRAPG